MFGQSEYRFSDGGHPAKLLLADTELFSLDKRAASANSIKWGSGRVLTNESSRRFARGSWAQDRDSLAPVFYDAENLPSHPKAVAKFNALPAA